MGTYQSPGARTRPGRELIGGRTELREAHPEIPDRELLARCRAGDGEAWNTLVQRYQPLIFTMATRSGLPPEDTADVTQASFEALLDAGCELREDERLGSWLMTVAHRQVWRTRRRLERATPAAPLPPQGNTIEDWERLTVLYDGLQQLDAPCRQLLVGLYLDPARPTYAAVARRLGVAIGTVGPMRGRCLGRLRSLMGEDR